MPHSQSYRNVANDLPSGNLLETLRTWIVLRTSHICHKDAVLGSEECTSVEPSSPTEDSSETLGPLGHKSASRSARGRYKRGIITSSIPRASHGVKNCVKTSSAASKTGFAVSSSPLRKSSIPKVGPSPENVDRDRPASRDAMFAGEVTGTSSRWGNSSKLSTTCSSTVFSRVLCMLERTRTRVLMVDSKVGASSSTQIVRCRETKAEEASG